MAIDVRKEEVEEWGREEREREKKEVKKYFYLIKSTIFFSKILKNRFDINLRRVIIEELTDGPKRKILFGS